MSIIDHINITVVGTSHIGLALTKCLLSHDANVVLTGRDISRVKQQAAELELEVDIQPTLNAVINADLIFLAVPDDKIEAQCRRLSINLKKGSTVVHFANALDSTVLRKTTNKIGVHSASLYVLNTFATLEESLKALSYKFHRTYVYSEGDKQALKVVNHLLEELDFLPVTIKRADKPALQAATTMAEDYLSVLMEMSITTAETAHIDRKTFWHSLQPLIKNVLFKIENNDSLSVLNSPVANGDDITVNQHLACLQAVSPILASTYATLGKQALSLSMKYKKLDHEHLLKVHNLLDNTNNKITSDKH